jgi:hypothetical protein
VKKVQVYLDDRKNGGRKLVEAELIEERSTTLKVKLLDGSTITRKKSRDLPNKENL